MANRVIELEPASHRDPSQVIPAMAYAILNREFDSEAVHAAIDAGRLQILECGVGDSTDHVVERIRGLRRDGCRTIGVFETTNILAAQLGVELSDAGMNYALLGIPEAQGEALAAQAVLFSFGKGQQTFDEARLQLAIFLTASWRGNWAPPLAFQIKDDQIVHPDLQDRFHRLQVRLREAESFDELLDVIANAWGQLGITVGGSSWDRASRSFLALARRIHITAGHDPARLATELTLATQQLRSVALQAGDMREGSRLHVMNRHQTKGREWDGVVLVFRHDEWVTSDPPPYEETYRLLYVTLTRARSRVVVIMPPAPHPLIAPFAALAR